MPRSPREAIEQLTRTNNWSRISTAEWNMLREALPATSESTLRKHLAALRLPIDQPWRGVDTKSLDALEDSLNELTALYCTEPKLARQMVIAQKDKTRFISRNPKVAAEKRVVKSEMVEWMLVWLGDPRMFAEWVSLRRANLSNTPSV